MFVLNWCGVRMNKKNAVVLMASFDKIPEKVKDLFMFIMSLVSSKFTGHIKVHFNDGNVLKKYKHEEVK